MHVKTRAVVTALEAWRPGPSLALQASPPVAECLVQIPEGPLQAMLPTPASQARSEAPLAWVMQSFTASLPLTLSPRFRASCLSARASFHTTRVQPNACARDCLW